MNVNVVAFDGCDQDVDGEFVLTPIIRAIGDVELGIVGHVGGGDDQQKMWVGRVDVPVAVV